MTMLPPYRNQSIEGNFAMKKINKKRYATAKLYIKLQNGYVTPSLNEKSCKTLMSERTQPKQ